MKPRILADTGPLVAFLHEDDRYHSWAVEQFATQRLPFYTCEAVLTETAYILDRLGLAPQTVFDLILSGAVVVNFEMEKEAVRLRKLMDRYADRPMDMADACLVRMAELEANSHILTIDSDFYVYRKHRTAALSVIMP